MAARFIRPLQTGGTLLKKCAGAYQCPVEATLELIGGKYKPVILWHLTQETLRFGELRKRIPRATPKMLTQHLRALEADGLIIRTVYPTVPPRVEYTLSDFGRTVTPVLRAMCDWGGMCLQRAEKPE